MSDDDDPYAFDLDDGGGALASSGDEEGTYSPQSKYSPQGRRASEPKAFPAPQFGAQASRRSSDAPPPSQRRRAVDFSSAQEARDAREDSFDRAPAASQPAKRATDAPSSSSDILAKANAMLAKKAAPVRRAPAAESNMDDILAGLSSDEDDDEDGMLRRSRHSRSDHDARGGRLGSSQTLSLNTQPGPAQRFSSTHSIIDLPRTFESGASGGFDDDGASISGGSASGTVAPGQRPSFHGPRPTLSPSSMDHDGDQGIAGRLARNSAYGVLQTVSALPGARAKGDTAPRGAAREDTSERWRHLEGAPLTATTKADLSNSRVGQVRSINDLEAAQASEAAHQSSHRAVPRAGAPPTRDSESTFDFGALRSSRNDSENGSDGEGRSRDTLEAAAERALRHPAATPDFGRAVSFDARSQETLTRLKSVSDRANDDDDDAQSRPDDDDDDDGPAAPRTSNIMSFDALSSIQIDSAAKDDDEDYSDDAADDAEPDNAEPEAPRQGNVRSFDEVEAVAAPTAVAPTTVKAAVKPPAAARAAEAAKPAAGAAAGNVRSFAERQEHVGKADKPGENGNVRAFGDVDSTVAAPKAPDDDASLRSEHKKSEAKRQRARREASERDDASDAASSISYDRRGDAARGRRFVIVRGEAPCYVEFAMRLEDVALEALDCGLRAAFVDDIAAAIGVCRRTVTLRGARSSVGDSNQSVLEARVDVHDGAVARALATALARAPRMLTKERFGATKYIGSISVRDDDDAVVRFDFASDAADQTDDSRPPRVSMAALGSDADANGAAFARSREVGTQHSGNHASCQADLDIPGLDGTEAFFAMPKEPPFRTVVHGVGYDASGAYAGAPRASLVGAFGAAAFPGTDDAAGYAAAVQQAAARSAAEQARSDQLLREAAARNSAVRNENADARAEAKEPTAGLESASAKAPPEQGPPPAAPGDAYGLSDHLPYSMPPYGLQPWAAYTPPQHAYAQIMYAQQQHSLFAQHGLYGYPMQPLMVGDGPSPPPRSPAAAQDQEPWPQRPTHSPATNVDSLTPRVLATQAIFRRQLDVIRQRLHAERFNADLAACGAGAMRFSSRQATSEYLDTHRPAPLPYWKAYMRVDPSLSENEARRLAVNHLQAQQAS